MIFEFQSPAASFQSWLLGSTGHSLLENFPAFGFLGTILSLLADYL